MDRYKIVSTTDGKNIGQVIEFDPIAKSIDVLDSDIDETSKIFKSFIRIEVVGNYLYLQNVHYTVIAKRI